MFLLEKEHPPSLHAKTGAVVKEMANTKGKILFIRKILSKAILKPFKKVRLTDLIHVQSYLHLIHRNLTLIII